MRGLPKIQPNENWTLFLDRDGVINKRPVNSYVTKPDDFEWIDGVIESINLLSEVFNTVLVVTNQQGIGKGLMTPEDLEKVHHKMLSGIHQAGGRIDKIYFCGDLDKTGSLFRKPAVGMGLLARKDFPHISFKKSIMVGDTKNDMIFGKRLKMYTVLIDKEPDIARKYPFLIDFRFADLHSFAQSILPLG